MMLGVGARSVRIWVYRTPVDMRKQYDGLAALVTRELNADIQTGDVYVCVGKTRKPAKAPMWDGTGLCLYSKRLVQGHFTAPWKCASHEAALNVTPSELALFFEGSEMVLRRPVNPPPYKPSRDVLEFK
jgi:transposase